MNITDPDGKPANVRLLRPPRTTLLNPSQPKNEEDQLDPHADSAVGGYRIIQLSKCAEMWNTCYKEHLAQGNECPGNLHFDASREVKVGLAWKQALKCDGCSYQSDIFKLYEEVDTGKSGPKPADINRSLQIGLAETMISNSAMRTILLATDIPAPSAKSMQDSANTVGKTLVALGQESMEKERNHLKHLNTICGLPADNPIRAEGDCRYNNALRSAGGTTPFQPATQAVYTICENNTPKKKIIAVSVTNKLCSLPGCKHNSEHCPSNLAKEESIGNERAWAYECAKDLAESGITIKHFTTDGDSKQSMGVSDAYCEMNINTTVENLCDPGHLSVAQKKKIKTASFSQNIFPAKTQDAKAKLQAKLALDIVDRCKAEFNNCHQALAGDVTKMATKLTHARDCLIQCLQGNHKFCSKKSFACRGTVRNHWSFNRLGDIRITPSASDETMLAHLIDMRLGGPAVKSTRLNTNTQKCESTNRAYLRTNPKCVTMTRNFSARIHGAVHSLNTGHAESLLQKTAAVGAKITGRARRQLKSEGKVRQQRKQLAQSGKYKKRRVARVKKNYTLHNKAKVSKPQVTYSKHMLDMKLLGNKHDVAEEHNYFHSPLKAVKEHSYAK